MVRYILIRILKWRNQLNLPRWLQYVLFLVRSWAPTTPPLRSEPRVLFFLPLIFEEGMRIRHFFQIISKPLIGHMWSAWFQSYKERSLCLHLNICTNLTLTISYVQDLKMSTKNSNNSIRQKTQVGQVYVLLNTLNLWPHTSIKSSLLPSFCSKSVAKRKKIKIICRTFTHFFFFLHFWTCSKRHLTGNCHT